MGLPSRYVENSGPRFKPMCVIIQQGAKIKKKNKDANVYFLPSFRTDNSKLKLIFTTHTEARPVAQNPSQVSVFIQEPPRKSLQ